MKLRGRDLQKEMTGEDVASLHNELFKLGYRIAENEIIDELYGETTQNAVVDFQTKRNMMPTGIFDATAAWLMSEAY